MGCEAAAAASSRAEGVLMSKALSAAGDAKARRLFDGDAPSRLLAMTLRPWVLPVEALLIWLKLAVMAAPPIVALEALACCDCAVVEVGGLDADERGMAAEGTLRGV